MATSSSRRLAATLASGLILAGVAVAPTASAAPSEHIVNTVRDVSCVFKTAQADLVFFGATASSTGGEAGSFMFVETLDFETVLTSVVGTAEFGAEGTFSAEVDLVSAETGEPVGTATVDALLTAAGAPGG